MTFREAILPFFQFLHEKWTQQGVRRLTTISFFALVVVTFFLVHAVVQNTTQLAILIQNENQNVLRLDALGKKIDTLSSHESLAVKTETIPPQKVLGTSTNAPTPTPTPVTTPHTTPIPIVYAPLGMVQVVNSGLGQTASVYDDPVKKNIVGRVTAGEILFYSKKSDGWYRIDVPDSDISAWISQSSVSELPK